MHHLHCSNQALAAEVNTPAGGSNVGMAQKLLHLIKAPTGIDQKRHKAVTH